MKQVKLRRTREWLEKATIVSKNRISKELLDNAVKVAKDPYEFSDLGYIDHDIVDTGKLSRSFKTNINKTGITLKNTAQNKGFRYPKRIRLGYNTKSGFRKGRPFYNRAIERSKVGQIYVNSLRNYGFNVKINRVNSDLF